MSSMVTNEDCLELMGRYPDGIHYADCKDVLETIEAGSVDLLLQDTPFGVTQNKWDVKPNLPEMWPLWNRATKESGAMIFFATQPFASELILSNAKNFRYDLIWYKALASGFLNAKKMPLRNHESILVFYRKLPTYNPQMGVGIRKKGKKTEGAKSSNYGKYDLIAYDDGGTRYPQSVLDFSNGDRTTESEHPTQKPLGLIRYLIRTYSNPGELVFDGYGGSGTTAVAAEEEGRRFIVCENHKPYFEQSEQRMKIKRSAPKLFNQ